MMEQMKVKNLKKQRMIKKDKKEVERDCQNPRKKKEDQRKLASVLLLVVERGLPVLLD